jgi:UDP-glucose:(heptosyl)LPS alpha-1,3-glucosyltransferase
MRIAIIRKKYTFHGGAEGFSSSFIENLADEGHEIHIFAIKWQSDSQHKNIHFHKVPAITFISLFRDLTFAVSSYVQLKRQRSFFDIIQTHDKALYQDVYRAGDGCHIEWLKQRWKRIGLTGKLPIVLNPYHWLILLIERSIFKDRRYKKVIAISELVKNNILDNYGIPSQDVEVIYNGVDINKFHPDNRKKYKSKIRLKHGLPETDFIVLFVGSGFERKGLKYLLRAVETVSNPVSILVAGKGSDKEFKTMPTHHKVIFCGPQKDIYKYYGASDIFVFPAIYEPFGNVHLEALASGLPVITTKNSGASEIIQDGIQGFVVQEPEDFRSIAQGINVLLNDKDKLRSMSKNARQLAEEFTFEKHIGRIKKLYEALSVQEL